MTGGGKPKRQVIADPDPAPSAVPIMQGMAAKGSAKNDKKRGRSGNILASRMMQNRQIFDFGKTRTGE